MKKLTAIFFTALTLSSIYATASTVIWGELISDQRSGINRICTYRTTHGNMVLNISAQRSCPQRYNFQIE